MNGAHMAPTPFDIVILESLSFFKNILNTFAAASPRLYLVVLLRLKASDKPNFATCYATLRYLLCHGLSTCYATPPTRYATSFYLLCHAFLPVTPRLATRYATLTYLLRHGSKGMHLPATPRSSRLVEIHEPCLRRR